MTKHLRHDPRLAEQFGTLDTMPTPSDLAPRLRAVVVPAKRERWPLLAAAAALLLAAAGFGLGRLSAPTAVSRVPATSAGVTAMSLVATTRDGNVISVKLAGSGLDPGSLPRARLRLSDGTDLVPEAVVPNGDGSVTLRYILPSQVALDRPNARLELPLGTGLWVQSIDLRSP